MRPGGAFVDIGAHACLLSMVADALVGLPGLASRSSRPSTGLRSDGQCAGERVDQFQGINAAIGDQTTLARFSSVMAAHSGIAHLDSEGDVSVLQINLDEHAALVAALIGDRPVMMKIDVEGAEVLVTHGMQALLRNPKVETMIAAVSTNQLARFGARDHYNDFL